jgi:hypothetical protein
MIFHPEHELESDGRWLAEAPDIPCVLAERIEAGESRPMPINIQLAAA